MILLILVLYCIQSGDQAATIIALCSLQDMNLYNDHCQLSIIDAGGLEVLINLLESENTKGMVRDGLAAAAGNLALIKYKVKYIDIAVRSLTCHTATGIHMPYRIT